jgi:glycolate oxidase FAD binding subunit
MGLSVSVATRSAGDALRAVTGPDRVVDDPALLASSAVDDVTPRWIVRPASVKQLAAVVAVAADEGLGMAPRGAGTALDLGRPPERLDVVLDLADLDGIVEHNADDLTVTVQAGLPLSVLNGYLRGCGQFLPSDPCNAERHTIGGLAATALSGPLRHRYGTMRDLLLGVRFVQADGVLTWGGSKVVKSVTGYDVPKLMVGSLGTLGVLTELTLRLHARPPVERTWQVSLPSADAAQALVGAVIDSHLQPSRLEIADAIALGALSLSPAPLAVLASFGSIEEAVTAQGEQIARLARASGGDTREIDAGVWDAYARPRGGGRDTTLRVGSLPGRLAGTHAAIVASLAGAACVVTGHAGLGVWHVTIPGAPPETVAEIVRRLRDDVAEHDGNVVIGGAPVEVRRIVDPWGPVAEGALELMRAVKRTFDPERRLNPGRFVDGL